MSELADGWAKKPVAGAAGSAEPAARGGFGTFIDHGAEFDGTLRLTQDFRIDGEFRGAIESDGRVIVGEAADVQANIRAREVVICGAVAGNVSATRLLSVRASARIQGDLESPCLEVAKGAVLNGHTRMTRPEARARATASQPLATP